MLLGRCSPACYRLCVTVQPQGTPSPWKIFQHFPGPRSGLQNLELWVLSHCSIYSVVSHIDPPAPQGAISYRIHPDDNTMAASSVAQSPKYNVFCHRQVPVSCHVQRPFPDCSNPAVPSHLSIFLPCFIWHPLEWGRGVYCLFLHKSAHKRTWLWTASFVLGFILGSVNGAWSITEAWRMYWMSEQKSWCLL